MKLVTLAFLSATLCSHAGVKLIENIDYVGKGDPHQTLDVIVPTAADGKKLPLVIYIHGGAWSGGSKEHGLPAMRLLAATGEYVTASINYRLVPRATWPAQIYDCKAAVRYLRGEADKYGIDPEHIGVIGLSAGGHLVSMLGTTGGSADFEGNLGPFPKVPSDVQCVVSFSGPVDFPAMGADASAKNAVSDLLGGVGPELPEKARKASPVTWVTAKSAPFLIAHGTKDLLVPYSQAEEMDKALDKAGVESHFITMSGGGHGFNSPELNLRVKAFFDKELRDQKAEIPETAIEVR